jgi:hypothetical protein
MRIMVRGWGRDQGEKELMNASLADAETADTYTWGKTYLRIDHPDSRWTKVRVTTSTELRLGGSYLLNIELSREEIAQLFYKTHGGDIVRMFRSFIQDENRQHYTALLEHMRRRGERRQQQSAHLESQGEQSE